MYIAASTGCFPDVGLPEVIDILNDLEFTAVEIVLDDRGHQVKPAQIVEDFDADGKTVVGRLRIAARKAEIAEKIRDLK